MFLKAIHMIFNIIHRAFKTNHMMFNEIQRGFQCKPRISKVMRISTGEDLEVPEQHEEGLQGGDPEADWHGHDLLHRAAGHGRVLGGRQLHVEVQGDRPAAVHDDVGLRRPLVELHAGVPGRQGRAGVHAVRAHEDALHENQ